jgi:DNA-binding LytR/AlgR family response regulator
VIAQAATTLNDRIFIHHRDRLVRILLADIKYVRAERAYCQIVTAGAEYTLSISLGALERQLVGNRLLRVHRSYLVNLRWVEEVHHRCLLVDGLAIPLTRAKREELGQYVRVIG